METSRISGNLSEESSDPRTSDADASMETETTDNVKRLSDDLIQEDSKMDVNKDFNKIIAMSNNDEDQKSETKSEQDNKNTKNEITEVAKNDYKIEESESTVKESGNKNRQSPVTVSSPLPTSREPLRERLPKANRAEVHVRLKEGKRKRRNPSIHSSGKDSPSEESEDKAGSESKRKRSESGSDEFCWRCHKEAVDARCSACPRSWHRRCMGGGPQPSPQNWICGECATILKAENAETRSPAMAQLSVDQLCTLLKHVVGRMRDHPGSEPFWKAVDLTEVPNYLDYVVKPMDLNLLECNMRAKLYGSTEAFMADAKWIQHNCIVFNTCGGVYTDTSKLTNAARQVIKAARQEVSEIEACPDCYAHARNLPRPQPSWFIEPCRRPHPLVWAKLKGFPFWPAKAMPRLNGQGHVDVRFFGAHDRAWVPPRDLYLYSQEPPAPPPRKRKLDMEECVREITRHCRKLEQAFGEFQLAPPKIQYNPRDPMQIKLMLPNYDPLTYNIVMPSQTLSPSPSPRRKPLRKRGGQLPLRKDSDSANDSTTSTPTIIPRHDSGSDCEKYIEATRISKGASSPLSKTDRCTSPSHNKSNSSPRVKVLSIHKDEEEGKAQNMSPDSQNSDDGKCITSTPVVTVRRNKVRRSKGNNDVQMEDESLKDRSIGKMIGDRQKQRQRQRQNGPIKDKTSDTSPSKNTSSDRTPTRRKEKTEEKESADISAISTSTPISTTTSTSTLTSITTSTSTSTQNTLSSPKTSPRTNKSQIRVYKPKTRMVNQVNAERAKESTADRSDDGMDISNLNPGETILTPVITTTDHAKSTTVTTMLTTTNSTTPNSKTISSYAATINSVASATITPSNHTLPTSVEQPLAFFLLVNNGISEVGKRHPPIEDNRSSNDSLAVIKQEPKDQQYHQRKESKARKSFPNKPPPFPQVASSNPPPPKAPASPPDAMVYIPAHRNENSTYQLPPPEAGPLSAQLHRGGQELARRMTQLMEEALRDASQSQNHTQNQINSSSNQDNPQATIHFLRLQMERMRWQHQQQLAELKHNTDLTLREMRASLEAERQRAIEETRREAEEERLRSVEETKRKQWCALCGNEALFYCCWNTAYCDYPCQQAHWPTHMRTCAQNQPGSNTNTNSNPNLNPNQHQVMMPRLVITTQHTASNVWGA